MISATAGKYHGLIYWDGEAEKVLEDSLLPPAWAGLGFGQPPPGWWQWLEGFAEIGESCISSPGGHLRGVGP